MTDIHESKKTFETRALVRLTAEVVLSTSADRTFASAASMAPMLITDAFRRYRPEGIASVAIESVELLEIRGLWRAAEDA